MPSLSPPPPTPDTVRRIWARPVPGLWIDLGAMAAALRLQDAELLDLRVWINTHWAPSAWDEGVAVLVDPGLGGEGSHDDMPSSVWDTLVETCRGFWPPAPGPMASHIQVRLELESLAELLGERGLWVPPGNACSPAGLSERGG